MNNFTVHTLLNNLLLYDKKGVIMVSSDPTEDTYSYQYTRFTIAPNDTVVVEFSDTTKFPPVINKDTQNFLSNHNVKNNRVIARNIDTGKIYDIIGVDGDEDPDMGNDIYLFINDYDEPIDNTTSSTEYVYNLICEITDEPCSAEVRTFANLEDAKTALNDIMVGCFENYNLEQDAITMARKSLEDGEGKAFTILLRPDDEIEFNAHIERTFVE